MKFDVKKNDYCKQRWKDKSGQRWPYIQEKDVEKLELNIEEVFADASNEIVNEENYLTFLGRKIWLSDKKEKLSNKEKIIGYIPCISEEGDEGYIRIIGKKSKKVWLIPLLIILLLAGILLGSQFLNNKGVDLDEAAISYQMPNGMKNENPDEIMIPVFTEISMTQNTRKIAASLANPEGNPCYFQYSIYLMDEEKLLYESGWIEPGTAVLEFEINQDLAPGEYPIQIRIKTGSLNDPEVEMNGGEVDCILKVE